MLPFKGKNLPLSRSCCEGNEHDTKKIGRATLSAGLKKAKDFFFSEDAISAWFFFQFLQADTGVFINPAQLTGSVAEGRGKAGKVPISCSRTALLAFCGGSVEKQLSLF